MIGSLNAISNYCIINCTTYVFNKLYLQTMKYYVFVAEEGHPSQELFHDQHERAGEAVTEFILNSPGNKI